MDPLSYIDTQISDLRRELGLVDVDSYDDDDDDIITEYESEEAELVDADEGAFEEEAAGSQEYISFSADDKAQLDYLYNLFSSVEPYKVNQLISDMETASISDTASISSDDIIESLDGLVLDSDEMTEKANDIYDILVDELGTPVKSYDPIVDETSIRNALIGYFSIDPENIDENIQISVDSIISAFDSALKGRTLTVNNVEDVAELFRINLSAITDDLETIDNLVNIVLDNDYQLEVLNRYGIRLNQIKIRLMDVVDDKSDLDAVMDEIAKSIPVFLDTSAVSALNDTLTQMFGEGVTEYVPVKDDIVSADDIAKNIELLGEEPPEEVVDPTPIDNVEPGPEDTDRDDDGHQAYREDSELSIKIKGVLAESVEAYDGALTSLNLEDVLASFLGGCANYLTEDQLSILEDVVRDIVNDISTELNIVGLIEQISSIIVDTISAKRITADVVDTAKLYFKEAIGGTMTLRTLESQLGTFEVVTAGLINADQLNAAKATIREAVIDELYVNTLNAKLAIIEKAIIDEADIRYAHITDGVIDNATIDQAKVNNLSSNYAHITNGVIDNAKINYADVNDLNAHYASIDLANVNNAWIDNGVIKDAAISDAQIIGVSANKLTAGTIDASNITVTNLNADNITTGTINGQRIGNGSIDLEKLAEEVPTKEYLDNVEKNLQGQIDGQIETWTGTVVPTLNNTPASKWSTAAEKKKHVGDIYYVVNAANEADGYTYRFTENSNGTYSWTLIKDNQITKALQDIIDIQGDVSGIKQFDSDISSWKTDTDSELSSIKSRTSTLETDMGKKVSTTTFNELKQTVDENSATITSFAEKTTSYNLLPSVYYREYVSGTEWTNNGITWTVNPDGSVTAKGTATATSSYWISGVTLKTDVPVITIDPDKRYTFSGCPEGGSATTYRILVRLTPEGTEPTSSSGNTYTDYGSGYTPTTARKYAYVSCQIMNGYTTPEDGITFYPMLEVGKEVSNYVSSHGSANFKTQIISNTVNEVKQTADSNSASITNLTKTVSDNKEEIDKKYSKIEQNLDGFKTTVSKTEAKISGQYAVSSTAAGTAAKVATITPAVTGWELTTGTTITVKFANANTAASPTLNVNSTGAKAIKTYANGNLTEAEYKWSAGSTFTFTYNGTNWLMQDSTMATRLSTAETNIIQNAEAITLRAYQNAHPNLSPYFSSTPYDTSKNTYWKFMNASAGAVYTFTDMGDGWMRVQCTNSGSSVVRADWYPVKAPNIKQGGTYTWLVEYRNNQSKNLVSTCDCYLVQTNNCQFWGATLIKHISDEDANPIEPVLISAIPTGTDGTVYTRRFTKLAEVATGGHWTNNSEASVVGLASWTWRCGPGATIDYEVRISVYEGEYRGPYKPYSGDQLYSTQAELKVASDEISTKVSKDGVISSINQSAESVKIKASKVEIDGTAIFSNSDFQNSLKNSQNAYTILWDYNADNQYAGGEARICKYDPETGTVSQAAGWAIWNGVKRTVPNVEFNPNNVLPYNIPIYLVLRLTSSIATTGIVYPVWYNDGWKYNPKLSNPAAADTTDWAWVEATDIILGKCVEPGNEAAFTDCEIFDPPYSSKQVTTDVVTARSANALATTANTTANNAAPKTSAVAEEQYIYISKASGTSSVDANTTWVTETGDKQNTWSIKRPTYNSSYPVLFVAKQRKVVSGTVTCTTPVKDDTTTVIDGGHITTGTIDASKATITNINADNIKSGTLSADRIGAGSIVVGKLATAVQNDISTAKSNAATALSQTVEYILGSQTASTNAWTGVTKDASLTTGKTISYKLPYAGTSTAATLNLTLSNGKTTGAKAVYLSNTAVTTHFPANSVIQMTYDGSVWRATAIPNTNTYDRTQYKASLTATAAIAAGRIGVINTSGNIILLSAAAFDVSKPILYIGTAYTDSALTQSNNYTFWGSAFNLTNTHAIAGAAAGKAVYIVGTLSGTTFTPNSTVLTCTIPTKADNLYYIRLGLMNTAANAILDAEHPIYAFINGSFQRVDTAAQNIANNAILNISDLSDTISVTSAQLQSDITSISDKMAAVNTSLQNLTSQVNAVSGYSSVVDRIVLDGNTGLYIYGVASTEDRTDTVAVHITGDKLSFDRGSNTIAYLGVKDDGSGTYNLKIEEAQVLQSLRFGDLAFVPRSNGNMALKYLGN